MRIYQNFQEAYSEVRRDLVEMGIRVHPKTYQDKDVSHDPNFETMELQNYIYTVTDPASFEGLPFHKAYVNVEWFDRLEGINGKPVNPGASAKVRPEVWLEFLDKDGKLAYTYSERYAMHDQVNLVIKRLQEDPDSRQCYLSVWQPKDISQMGGISRIPCSLGYQIQVRKDKLNMTYLQRSCDFATHFPNDVALSSILQRYISSQLGIRLGTFTHWIGSLHIFKKDAEGVF